MLFFLQTDLADLEIDMRTLSPFILSTALASAGLIATSPALAQSDESTAVTSVELSAVSTELALELTASGLVVASAVAVSLYELDNAVAASGQDWLEDSLSDTLNGSRLPGFDDGPLMVDEDIIIAGPAPDVPSAPALTPPPKQ
jgi:hypothetical protein